jgi:F0F1-type ATP synthase assembly protein I
MDRELHMTFEEKKILLEQAEKNANNLEGNYGGHHAFAETVAMVFEDLTAEQRTELTNSKKNWLENAKISALLAIDRDKGYAKFYCTYGRVLALLGDLDGAMSNVSRAISFEKSSRKDYSIRIGQYSSYYQQFRAQKKLEEQKAAIDAKVEEVNLQMEASEKESMAKNMEFLGLFSGIVSFTIGSISISGEIDKFTANQVAGLIVVMMGALMGVFAGFGIILHGADMRKRNNYKGLRNLLVLLMGTTYAANQLSPTHICLTLIAEYFEIPLGTLFRRTIPAIAMTMVFAIGYYLVWTGFFI